MRTFLAKCAVLALIAGGFAFTGDAGRLVARGKGVIEATTVPSDVAAEAAPLPTLPGPPPVAPSPSPAGAPPLPGAVSPGMMASDPPVTEAGVGGHSSVDPSAPSRAVPPADAPVGTPIATSPPPADAPTSVDISRLTSGERVVIWIGRHDARTRLAGRTIAFDVVDPASGECLEVRHPSGVDNAALHAPCRRVRIIGSVAVGFFGTSGQVSAGKIVTKQSLQISPVAFDGATPAAGIETIGPILALTVARP